MKRRANANVDMKSSTAQEFRMANLSRDLTKQITRTWKAGDVYGPNDLSPYEMSKWKQRRRPDHDVFDLLDVNPLDEFKVHLPVLA
jgi:small subunit ribosomal protein S18